MSPFLEREDVERLTGFVMSSKQLQWCKNNGVRAYLSAKGEVIVPRTAIDGKPAANDDRWRPDFSKILTGE
jgi:hypothetical protein